MPVLRTPHETASASILIRTSGEDSANLWRVLRPDRPTVTQFARKRPALPSTLSTNGGTVAGLGLAFTGCGLFSGSGGASGSLGPTAELEIQPDLPISP